ncbi:MAG: hypothetical protein CVT84_08185, partial [Alphaproteobacteria bacterium HGW-Alphaproteobacteria-6]
AAEAVPATAVAAPSPEPAPAGDALQPDPELVGAAPAPTVAPTAAPAAAEADADSDAKPRRRGWWSLGR